MAHDDYEHGTLGPFAFEWDTDTNLDVFERAFLRVWDAMRSDCKEPIEQFCNRVAYVSRFPSDFNGAGGLTYLYENRRSEVRIRAAICREATFDGVCNIIAHELRHCWQHATDWKSPQVEELSKAEVRRIAWEKDAKAFAADLGFSLPASVWLAIPDDPLFSSIVDSWALLKAETRQALSQAATNEAAGMREGVKLCWTDRRFLDVRDTWELLSSEQRDELIEIIRTFPGCD